MRLDCDILSQRSIPPPPKVGSKRGKLEATMKKENMKQTLKMVHEKSPDTIKARFGLFVENLFSYLKLFQLASRGSGLFL